MKGGAMINTFAIRAKTTQFAVGLVASYCKGCGLFIAPSPRRKILDMMEIIHHCPVHFNYIQSPETQNRCMPTSTPGARLLVYLE